jgi:hypothetical protein
MAPSVGDVAYLYLGGHWLIGAVLIWRRRKAEYRPMRWGLIAVGWPVIVVAHFGFKGGESLGYWLARQMHSFAGWAWKSHDAIEDRVEVWLHAPGKAR